MKITIKKRFSNEVLLEGEAKNLKEFVEKNKADLRGAYLEGADLRGAYLWGAYLEGANLEGANLWGTKIKTSQKDELLKSIGIVIK